MRRAIVLSFSVLVASCVGDAPVSTPTPDAGSPDTSTNDSSVTDAGGGDGPIADAAKGWCAQNAPTALLCDDFDEGQQPKGWWSIDLAGSVGTVTVDGTGAAASAPNAVRSATPAVPTTQSSTARLHHVETVANVVKWTLEADVWLDSSGVPDAGATQRPVALLLSTSANDRIAFQLIPWSNSAFFAGYGSVLIGASVPFTPKVWHHVKMVVDRNGTQYTPTVTVDSTTQPSGALSGGTASLAGADVGLGVSGQVPALELFVDNVVLTTN